jgi:tetratricopeptide (TPR) repeat protein
MLDATGGGAGPRQAAAIRAPEAPVAPAPDAVAEVRALYDAGRFVDAYWRARREGPLERWGDTDARILAGRLLTQVGARRAGRLLHSRAFRSNRAHADAAYYYTYLVGGRRGPLAALRFMEARGDLVGDTPHQQASWLALRARLLAGFRDFESAAADIERARRISPDDPWIAVELAALQAAEDRNEEALETARAALALRADYIPALLATAVTLASQDHFDEARELLVDAVERVQAASVACLLAALESEADNHHAAISAWRRAAALSPAMDIVTFREIAAALANAHHPAGDFDLATMFGRASGLPVLATAAARTEAARSTGARRRLDTRFIRQHHATCVPACLSTVARYWNRPADHVAVAEEICWDGTSAAAERRWAESHGFLSRELTVTWEVTMALVDRGVPFVLTTVAPVMGHAQVVVGYDTYRGGLIVRDPSTPGLLEIDAESLLAAQAAYGPRGHVLLPAEEAPRLDGLTLPDGAEYDELFAVDEALRRHDRGQAQEIVERFAARSPDHRLVLQARRALAAYDEDEQALLAYADAFLVRFPRDPTAQLLRVSCLTNLARESDRLQALSAYAESAGAHPMLRLARAALLAHDPRERPSAIWELESVARQLPGDASVYAALAGAFWADDRRAEAVVLTRFACCLRPSDEQAAANYFAGAHHLGRREEALGWLQRRAARGARQSSEPALTLARLLAGLQRASEARQVLEDQRRARPEDGALLLAAATSADDAGDTRAADTLLEEARGRCKYTHWLRAAAQLHARRGQHERALACWREVLETEPHALDAHQAVTFLLIAQKGWESAIAHVEAAASAAPFHVPMQQLAINVCAERAPDRALPIIERFLDTHPDDGWALRARAQLLAQRGEVDAALVDLTAAETREPSSPLTAELRGRVLAHAGRTAEAASAYREAIAHDPDRTNAMVGYVDAAATAPEAVERLGFVAETLRAKVTDGSGIGVYCKLATDLLPDVEAVLRFATDAVAARPDLWSGWRARVQVLASLGRLDEAEEVARQATDRLPLLLAPWLVRAERHRARGHADEERGALERALELRPADPQALMAWAAFQRRAGDLQASIRIAQRIRAAAPFQSAGSADLAELQRASGSPHDAWATLERAIEIDPTDAACWNGLAGLANQLQAVDQLLAFTRTIAKRASDPETRLFLDQVLELCQAPLEERLGLLRDALAHAPMALELRDRLAVVLATARRFDEARDACGAAAGAIASRIELRGRLAWITAVQSDLPKAIAEMTALVTERPRYVWGHVRLGEWQLERHDAAAAVRSVADAAASSPGDIALGHHLFELQLKNKLLDDARITFERLRARSRDPGTLLRGVRLEVAHRRRDAALAALVALARCERTGEAELKDGMRSIALLTQLAEWVGALEPVLAEPGVSPALAPLWVGQAAATVRPARFWPKLEALLARPPGAAAIAAYLRWLADGGQRSVLLRFVRRYDTLLRKQTRLWADVATALVNLGRARLAVPWLADWRDRPDVEPWMLVNAAIAYRSQGDLAGADAVTQHALALPRDWTFPYHASTGAFEAAVRGDLAVAKGLLDKSIGPSPTIHADFWHALGRAVVLAADNATQPDRRRRLVLARESFYDAVRAEPPLDPTRDLGRGRRRASRAIARAIGGPKVWLWALLAG